VPLIRGATAVDAILPQIGRTIQPFGRHNRTLGMIDAQQPD
jgi:hypothetical protein